MTLTNTTDFPADALPMTGPGNHPFQVVMVKATFSYESGAPEPAKPQIPIFYGDEMFEQEESPAVRFETDVLPFKPVTDIVVTGKAYAPQGRKTPSFDAGIRVGETAKSIRVFGDRVWEQEPKIKTLYRISRARPVTEMELRYERAFGGNAPDNSQYVRENPVGTGFFPELAKEGIKDRPLPNIEDPDRLITAVQDTPPPAGLGFCGRGWEPRLSRAGTYDDHWRKTVSPGFPGDFDFGFFNGAHPGLQTRVFLKGNEAVELSNLSPLGNLSFHLPDISPVCTVKKRDQEPTALPLALDTLCFLTEEALFYMVWRGRVPIADMGSMEIENIEIST